MERRQYAKIARALNVTVEDVFQATKVIGELEESGAWTFSYMGANQDAVLTASRFGISAGNSINYSSTSAGASAASQTLTRALRAKAQMSNVAYMASVSVGDVSLDTMNLSNNTFFSDVVDGNVIGEDLSNLKDSSDTNA